MKGIKSFRIVKYLLISLLCHSLIIVQVLGAEIQDRYLPQSVVGNRAHGNEYVSGDTNPDAVFIRVNLWGAIGKPGIHFIPYHTDVVTLLSYAGGPTENSNLDDVVIRRQLAGKEEVIPVDVAKLMKKGNQKVPQLEANDLIVVPGNSKVSLLQSITGGLQFALMSLSLVLTLFVLGDRLKSNSNSN